ncbi:MAG TPA: hypothetical protein DCZ75_11160 [Geobacter sp.]|nr:hypothetical protein [Geobacter sp.]
MPSVRYEHVHQIKFTAVGARTIGDLIHDFEENLQLFKRWEEKGIKLDPHGVGSNYAIFYTDDEEIAKEEGFERIRTESGNPLPRR